MGISKTEIPRFIPLNMSKIDKNSTQRGKKNLALTESLSLKTSANLFEEIGVKFSGIRAKRGIFVIITLRELNPRELKSFLAMYFSSWSEFM